MTKSLKNLSGRWSMDRKASSGVPDVMTIQGFSFLMRKAVAVAPINLTIKQPSEAELFIDQTTTANIPGISEEWYPGDHEWREQKDRMMGKVRSRTRWIKLGDVQGADERLTKDLSEDEEVIEAEVESLDVIGWKARQIWCMEGSEFVRRIVVTGKNGDQALSRLVYRFERE